MNIRSLSPFLEVQIPSGPPMKDHVAPAEGDSIKNDGSMKLALALLAGEYGKDQPIPPGYFRHEVRTYMISAKVEDGFVQFYFKQRPGKPDYTGDGPLDVRIPHDCYIRFVLDPELHWSFRREFDKKRAGNLADLCDAIDRPDDITCSAGTYADIKHPEVPQKKPRVPDAEGSDTIGKRGDDLNVYNDAVTLNPTARRYLYHSLRHTSDQEVIFFARKWVKPLPKTDEETGDQEAAKKRCIMRHFGYDQDDDWDGFNIYVEMDVLAADMVSSGKRHRHGKRLLLKIDPDIKNPGDDTKPKVTLKDLKQDIQRLLDDVRHLKECDE